MLSYGTEYYAVQDGFKLQSVGETIETKPSQSALVFFFFKNFATGILNSFVKFNFGHCFKGFEVVNLSINFLPDFPRNQQ